MQKFNNSIVHLSCDFEGSDKHHFHLGCLIEWVRESDQCPDCNEFIINKTNQLKPLKPEMRALNPLIEEIIISSFIANYEF